jgi:cytochrome c oxidase subunit II
MYKWIMFVVFIGAVVLGMGALFQEVGKHAKEAAPEPDAGNTLKIVASNYQFDKPEYTVKAGQKMKVVFQLKEGIHEMEIPQLNVKLTKANPSQEVTFDKAGTYDLMCVLPCGPGHANMKSKITVQ